MATGAKAVQRIAEATAILPATVSRAARTLREANPDLWPEAGKGGGKRAAHVEPRHLVNLVLALAVADPITSAPDAVVTYRSLTPQVSRSSEWSENRLLNSTNLSSTDRAIARNAPGAPPGVTWLTGETLGEGLEQLISLLAPTKTNSLFALAYPDTLPVGGLSDTLQRSGLTVVLTIGQVPRASVRGWSRGEGENGWMKTDLYSPEPGSPSALAACAASLQEAAIERETTIRFSLFKVLGELWADTLAHQIDNPTTLSLLGEAAPAADQENENAGTSPEDPAPTRAQSRANGSRTLTSLEHMEEREKSQPPRQRGRSTPSSDRRSRCHVHLSDFADVAAA